MLHLLQVFMNICLFQAKPQDLPVSRFLFFGSLIVTVVTGLPSLLFATGTLKLALVAVLMDVTLVLVLLRGGLYFLQLEPRFLQTATALFGTGAIFNLVAIPIHQALAGVEAGGGQAAAGALLFLMLLGWSLAVNGHILRHTFSIRLAGGIAIATVYFFLITLLVQQLIPVSQGL